MVVNVVVIREWVDESEPTALGLDPCGLRASAWKSASASRPQSRAHEPRQALHSRARPERRRRTRGGLAALEVGGAERRGLPLLERLVLPPPRRKPDALGAIVANEENRAAKLMSRAARCLAAAAASASSFACLRAEKCALSPRCLLALLIAAARALLHLPSRLHVGARKRRRARGAGGRRETVPRALPVASRCRLAAARCRTAAWHPVGRTVESGRALSFVAGNRRKMSKKPKGSWFTGQTPDGRRKTRTGAGGEVVAVVL